MDIKKYQEAFANIEVHEEQIAVLDSFFKEFANELKTKARTEVETELKAAYAESNENVVLSDEDRASMRAEIEAEVKADYEEKFKDMEAKIKESFSESLIDLTEEVYDALSDKVSADWKESEEYVAFSKVKEAIFPITEKVTPEAKALETALAEKQSLVEELQVLKRNQIVENLVKGFSEKEANLIKEFLEDITDEDEIYKQFSKISAVIENKMENDESEVEDEDDDILDDEDEEDDDSDEDDEEEFEDDEETDEEDEEIEDETDDEDDSTTDEIDGQESVSVNSMVSEIEKKRQQKTVNKGKFVHLESDELAIMNQVKKLGVV